MKLPPVHFKFDKDFKRKKLSFRNVPIHYQSEVSKLLDFLRKKSVKTDVSLRRNYDCVRDVVLTDKKNSHIRMGVDNTPKNPGMKRTKYYFQTPQKIRHELKEAKAFSEVDLGWAFHQLLLGEESKNKSVFQTHEELHCMEHFYFSPTAASGIFHGEVHKTFGGLASVTNIHDNIFVYAKDYPNHYDHLKVILERCVELDILHKPSRSTIGLTRVKWFGREFHSNGVTTDQEKISKIKNAGRPSTAGEIRSL